MNRLLPVLLTAFIIGLVLSKHLTFKASNQLILTVVLLLLFILFSLSHSRLDNKSGKRHLLLSWLLFVGIGCLYAKPFNPEHLKPKKLLSLANEQNVHLAGVLAKMPVFLPDRTELLIKTEQYFVRGKTQPVKGQVLLCLKDRPQMQVSCGDKLLWMGRLYPVTNFKNPGAFDFENYMALRGIYVTGWVSNPQLLAVIGHKSPSPFESIENIRLQIQNFLDNAPPLAASLYKALIIGERRGIPQPTKEAFTRAGVNHILAISGLHMGMVALVAYTSILWIIKRFPYLLLKFSAFKIAAWSSIPIVLFYGAISGLSPPSLRAMIMVGIFLIAISLGKQWEIYNNLAIAIWAILLFSPRTLYVPSFQLSVMAVFFIVFLYPRWQNWFKRKRETPLAGLHGYSFPLVDKLWKMVLISAIATLGTAPMVAYYFHRLSLVGLLSNVIVIPLVGLLVLPLGLLSVTLIPFSLTLADIFLQTGSIILTATTEIIGFLATWPISSVWVVRPCWFEIILFYAGILLVTMASDRRTLKWCGLVCLSMIFIVEIAGAYQRSNSHLLKVTFLDVGQGNSAFVQFPGGKNMVIDGGGTFSKRFDIGERVIAPFLRAKKVRTIDYVVLTHPHPDHLEGLVFLLDSFKVKEIWSNGDQAETEAFSRLQQLISSKGILKREFNLGGLHTFMINGAIVDIYSPNGSMNEANRSDSLLNRRSLVIKITHGHRHFLFPGDIDSYREHELLKKGYVLKSDILLAPHHGSNTSSTSSFIKAVNPEAVVFSVGRLNRFSFPHPDVVKKYEDTGCYIYRTGYNGAITCITDGDKLQIKPFYSSK